METINYTEVTARKLKKTEDTLYINLWTQDNTVLNPINTIPLPSLFKEFNLYFPLDVIKYNKIHVTAHLHTNEDMTLYSLGIKQKIHDLLKKSNQLQLLRNT